MNEVKSTHVGAYGFIIKDDCIALIKKARGGYKGMLDILGGGIEHDETPSEALKRELMEEAGVTVNNFELIADYTSLRVRGETQAIGLLRQLFGTEVMDMLENTYQSMLK